MDLENENKPAEMPAAEDSNPPVEETSNPVEAPVVEATLEDAQSITGAVEMEAEPVMEDVNTEPVVEEVISEPQVTAKVVPEQLRTPGKTSFWRNLLIWAIIAVVFFLAGLATIFFGVHQPFKAEAEKAASTAQEQITTLTDDLAQAEIAKSLLQTDLDTTRGELTTAEATIQEQAALLADTTLKQQVYKFMANVNTARFALQRTDTATARQAISFAREDLKELESSGLEADSLSGFSARLDEAASNLFEPDSLISSTALDTLYEQVLQLANRLP